MRILRLAKTGVGLSDTVPVDVSVTERHEYEISRYLDTLYSGDPCYNGAVRLCRLLGSSIPIALYYNTISGNAFEPYFAGRRYIAYLGALFLVECTKHHLGTGKPKGSVYYSRIKYCREYVYSDFYYTCFYVRGILLYSRRREFPHNIHPIIPNPTTARNALLKRPQGIVPTFVWLVVVRILEALPQFRLETTTQP